MKINEMRDHWPWDYLLFITRAFLQKCFMDEVIDDLGLFYRGGCRARDVSINLKMDILVLYNDLFEI